MSLPANASDALRRAFLDLYLLASHVRHNSLPEEMAETIREQADHGVRSARDQILRAGVPEKWVNDVEMAVVGLIDESARRGGSEPFSGRWQSLQYVRYQHEDVGRKAFEKLEALRAAQDTPVEVLEVFSRCISMGFEGRYAPDQLRDLKVLEEGLRNDIVRRLGPLPPLAPHLGEAVEVREPPQILEPRWIIGIAVGMLILVGLGLTLMLSRQASQVENRLQGLLEAASPAGEAPFGQGGPK